MCHINVHKHVCFALKPFGQLICSESWVILLEVPEMTVPESRGSSSILL